MRLKSVFLAVAFSLSMPVLADPNEEHKTVYVSEQEYQDFIDGMIKAIGSGSVGVGGGQGGSSGTSGSSSGSGSNPPAGGQDGNSGNDDKGDGVTEDW